MWWRQIAHKLNKGCKTRAARQVEKVETPGKILDVAKKDTEMVSVRGDPWAAPEGGANKNLIICLNSLYLFNRYTSQWYPLQ